MIKHRSWFQTHERKVCRIWRGKVEIRLILKGKKTHADILSVMIRSNIKYKSKAQPLQVLVDLRAGDSLGTCGLPPPCIVFQRMVHFPRYFYLHRLSCQRHDDVSRDVSNDVSHQDPVVIPRAASTLLVIGEGRTRMQGVKVRHGVVTPMLSFVPGNTCVSTKATATTTTKKRDPLSKSEEKKDSHSTLKNLRLKDH